MIRKWWFGIAFVFAGSLIGTAVAADAVKTTVAAPAESTAAPFVHTVIFHLKKDAPVEKIIEGCHTLTAIPTVRALKAGRPAPTDESTEKVVARDYDLGLVVLFEDAAGLKTYLTHPTHLQFVKDYGQYFDKVQVFDFSDEKK